jgi:hypothetical protein
MRLALLGSVGVIATLAGCSQEILPSKFAEVEQRADQASPLGPSFVLIGQPTDDDSILGKIVTLPIDDSHALETRLAPNPCADKLTETKSAQTLNGFEDAQELGLGASAEATLGRFGFQGDVAHATHLLYKISTQKRVARQPTVDYEACCKEKACGVGYVSTLVFGDGEYSSAEETDVSGRVDVAVASASGTTALKTLHRHTVRGYIAAIVTTSVGPAAAPSAPQPPPAPKSDSTASLAAQLSGAAKSQYAAQRITICDHPELKDLNYGPTSPFSFCTQSQDGHQEDLTENEFVRRYRATTGFHDLDDHELDRFGAAAPYLSIASLGIAVAGTTYAIAAQQPYALAVAIPAGVAGAIVGLMWLATHEGSDNSRFGYPTREGYVTSEHDARLAVARYNRALARKIAEGALTPSTTRSSLRFEPLVGAGFLGVGGSF